MAIKNSKVAALKEGLFTINNDQAFEDIALEVFRFQYENNPLYHRYCCLTNTAPELVKSITGIPFLPISFFKTHAVQTTFFQPEVFFESSGTTGSVNSRHLVKEAALYEQAFIKGAEFFYGSLKDYCILALLPSYLEKGQSSLVYMVKGWMERSGHAANDFYLYDFEKLAQTLKDLQNKKQKTILIGVTYALLDFAEQQPQPLKHTLIIETGGMKGRREEAIRTEVHSQLKNAFSLSVIHSEYGMTELLSQAYAPADGRFTTPPWMKVLLREEDDHKGFIKPAQNGSTGGINCIDLANLFSCSFIATEDVGRMYSDGSFEVLGRMDNTDIRGCSLMAV